MKLRTVMKIAVISSVVLLCTGFAMFSFFKLSAAEDRDEFNLYKLVPPTASAVFETDDLAGFMQDIDELSCSKNHQFLYVSKLFSYLKVHLDKVLDDIPHGLSRQMNKVLLSFHQPDNDRNQVLYCSLSSDDKELVEKFIQKYTSASYPSKTFEYKGEEICIYPMADGDFLACYYTPEFLTLSYQKKLIEEVIDARLSRESLLHDSSFVEVHTPKKNSVAATLYIRMNSLDMGKMTDHTHARASLGGWTEFDMKMHGNIIYFSGVSHDSDTCFTFMNMLRRQQPVRGFPGDILPASTFFFSKRSVSDLASMLRFTKRQEYGATTYSGFIRERDEELSRYLQENGEHDLMTCLFQRGDTLTQPAAVMSVPVRDVTEAERLLRRLIEGVSLEESMPPMPRATFCYTDSKAYPLYVLPRNTLFTQLTGITKSALYVYATFYGGRLLLAPDPDSLSRYIHFLNKGEVLEGTSAYVEGANGLSDSYNFMLMADFADIFRQPENYVRLVPSFFFRSSDFFRHFILCTQFTCTDGVVYPNVVLLYKGE